MVVEEEDEEKKEEQGLAQVRAQWLRCPFLLCLSQRSLLLVLEEEAGE